MFYRNLPRHSDLLKAIPSSAFWRAGLGDPGSKATIALHMMPMKQPVGSLPFCVRFNATVTTDAATLDTGPRAKSYPGGNRTHLSMNHFQFAPDPHVRWCGEGHPQGWPLPDYPPLDWAQRPRIQTNT